MYNLLAIGDFVLKDPEGSFNIQSNDVVNEYKGEDGHKTIEVIRNGQISGSVSYKGLTAEQLKEICDHLGAVTHFQMFNVLTNAVIEITARVSGVKAKKIHHKGEVSVWSLSFNIDEL